MEALWACLDQERPSGDDPKRVVLALNRFFIDFQQHLKSARTSRWKTPLFRELEPVINRNLEELISLTEALGKTLPQSSEEQLRSLRQLDRELRRATASLEEEEANCGLPVHPSPKLNQFNYLFEGWCRGYLPAEPILRFAKQYHSQVTATGKEIAEILKRTSQRQNSQETQAATLAQQTIAELALQVEQFRVQASDNPESCRPLVQSILALGERLGEAFKTLENAPPLGEPCPFCGGQISLSGRCRSCSRRLPHLEEIESQGGEPQSEFLSNNCREVDTALRVWEAEPENLELWQRFQKAVQHFASAVTQGRKSLENLAASPDRPIDHESDLRSKEAELKKVGEAFQDALSTLARFSRSCSPPEHSLDPQWREPLAEAELTLQRLQTALQPDSDETAL